MAEALSSTLEATSALVPDVALLDVAARLDPLERNALRVAMAGRLTASADVSQTSLAAAIALAGERVTVDLSARLAEAAYAIADERAALMATFELQLIRIHTWRGWRPMPALRKGALAAHAVDAADGHAVTHLPTGRNFAAAGMTFDHLHEACAAVDALLAMRPDWDTIGIEQIMPLGRAIHAVARTLPGSRAKEEA